MTKLKVPNVHNAKHAGNCSSQNCGKVIFYGDSIQTRVQGDIILAMHEECIQPGRVQITLQVDTHYTAGECGETLLKLLEDSDRMQVFTINAIPQINSHYGSTTFSKKRKK